MKFGTPAIDPGLFANSGSENLQLLNTTIATLTRDVTVGALVAYGQGFGAGTSKIRPVVAEADNPAATLGVGEEVIVTAPLGAGWIWLPFEDPPRLRAGHKPLIGLFQTDGGPLQLLGEDIGPPANAAGLLYFVPYTSSGRPDISGPPSGTSFNLRMLAVAVEAWQVPDVPDEQLVATLPFDVVADFFDEGGGLGNALSANAGWHYLHDAPPPPATAIVRTGGPLEDLVGNRIRITAQSPDGPRVVSVYVIDEQPFDDELADEDISLSRVAFARLAPMWTDLLSVTVEVLA